MNARLERVHGLVDSFGWNTTCYQIINPRLEHWFSPRGDAVVGYLRRQGMRIVAGAPVCAQDRLESVVAEYEAADPGSVCYFGAEGRLRDLLVARPDYSTVSLGSQPVWNPETYVSRFDDDRSLRAQRNRATNKGVVVTEWAAERATADPRLRVVLDQWLRSRGLPPMHFLVEAQTLDNIYGRRLFVAEMEGDPVGFVTLCPAPARGAWLTEQFVRGDRSPNGTVELALRTAVSTICRDGAAMVTMGIVPLSEAAEGPENPAWLRFAARWAKAHGRRFYDFDGLEWFKSKFHPQRWEAVYVVSKEPHFSPRTLWAIAAAFSEGSPATALLQGLGRAAAAEWRKLRFDR